MIFAHIKAMFGL